MSGTRPFTTLARTTVAEQIRDEIFSRVTSGELKPGSQLPAERVLAEDFGVARTSVREAIQALIALGVIERRGNRSYVTERVTGPDLPSAAGRLKMIRDLLAARRLLEHLLFELAAARASARERQRTMELARQPLPGNLEELIVADRQFHASIVSACGNPVLTEIYGRVVETLMTENLSAEVLIGIGQTIDEHEAIARVISEHLAIAEAFAASDASTMLDLIDRHVGPVEGWIGRTPRRSHRHVPLAPEGGLDRTVGM